MSGGPIYDLSLDAISLGDNPKYKNTSPSWVVRFVRFPKPIVGPGQSDTSKLETRHMTVINDVINVSVSSRKGAPVHNANLTLLIGEIDYSNRLNVGDHIFIWMRYWQVEADQLKFDLDGSNKRMDGFDSGLKFAGKIISISKTVSVTPNGIPEQIVSIQAQMFTELLSSVMVAPLDTGTNAGLPQQSVLFQLLNPQVWAEFNKGNASKQISAPHQTPDSITAFFLGTFLGNGVNSSYTEILSKLNSTLKPSYNTRMIYPKEASRIFLGPKADTKNNFFDIMNLYTGIESYNSGNANNNKSLLVPKEAKRGRHRKSQNLKGIIGVITPSWDNQPLWSIINEWSNPAANEIYTTLRYDPTDDGIRPTVVHRQIPFTTPDLYRIGGEKLQKFKKARPDADSIMAMTNYVNLPRWKIEPFMVTSINIGTSNDGRVNFVKVDDYEGMKRVAESHSGGSISMAKVFQAQGFVDGNFFYDEDDIKKHGFKAQVMNSFMTGYTTGSVLLSAMQADFRFNGHLKFTGRLTTYGIAEPICVGDNLEYQNVLYHIEGVDHMCRINPDGSKTYRTIFTLSQGLVLDKLIAGQVAYPSTVQEPQFAVTDIQKTVHGNRDSEGQLANKKDKGKANKTAVAQASQKKAAKSKARVASTNKSSKRRKA
jgi:hypothetical protein